MQRRLAATVLALVAALYAGCHAGSEAGLSGRYAGQNIVLVTIDTLRADHLGVYGYARRTSPRLDAIAAQGVVFERAFAPAGLTWPSLTAMLTSSDPRTNNVRKNGELLADGTPTLLTAAQRGGYTTAAFLANACNAFHAGIDFKRCGKDDKVTREAVAWLRKAPPEPFLLWVHYIAPHSDYAPPQPFNVFVRRDYRGDLDGKRANLDRVVLGESPITAEELEHVIALYDGEVLYADTSLGTLWSELRDRGLLDRSLAVISADHGEDLFQHNGYFFHACSVHDSTLHIPLVLRLPDGAAAERRVETPVGNVDIGPTLLDLVGLPVPDEVAGRSLVPLLEGRSEPPDPVALSEFYQRGEGEGEILSLRDLGWRFVYNPNEIRPRCEPEGDFYRVEREELYDLATDPSEAHNVLEQHPEVAQRLRERAQRSFSADPGPAPIRVDREEAERLRALGYLERY